MKNLGLFLLALLILFFVQTCQTTNPPSERVADATGLKAVDSVDPFIGTAAHGHTYPGATVPFGMVQLSPDNGTQGWDWCAGYNYIDTSIIGFTHTHLSGTGIGDLYDLLVMPTLESVDLAQAGEQPKDYLFATTFDHKNETASPGYYSVLMDNGIRAELTTTIRVGFHQYSFPEHADPGLIVDLGHHINWDAPMDTKIRVENDSVISGYRHSSGWAKNQRLFFTMAFSHPVKNYQLADGTTLKNGSEIIGKQTKVQLFFGDLPEGEKLMIKVGLSSADEAGAKKSLTEVPHWDFMAVKEAASTTWAKELEKVQIETADQALSTTFYTALYHTNLAPVIFSDLSGRYKGVDDKIHQASDYDRYDIFSLWDTFRAAHPLFTLLQQGRVNDMVYSIMAHYSESGLLPVWSLLGNETNTMTGYHAIPVLADAYLKGLTDMDPELMIEAMQKSAMQDIRGTNYYRDYGYIPYDKDGESVTKTLEYAYDDWCIAQMAKALNKSKVHEAFSNRAKSYQPLFDRETGFMRARLADGSWKTPFDPQYSDHNFDVAEYTEGNAWQHSWFVPHDVQGLIDLHGGPEAFVTKLDSLFVVDSEITGDNVSADISGLIGQYAHGNEPSHHIAYLYNYAGVPWKTQKMVRQILETQYDTSPAGLCGNEDCGQMSAWYVFSALGFYPVNPAEGIYVIGTPLMDRATLNLGNGIQFSIIANQVSKENFYIQSAKLNGKPLNRCYLTHNEIVSGGQIVFEMGNTPNLNLWTESEAFPPSMSRSN